MTFFAQKREKMTKKHLKNDKISVF